MGNYLMRTMPDSEIYVLWSTNIDGPLFAGTQREVYDYMLERIVTRAKSEILSDLQLATETGTSVQTRLPGETCSPGAWADEGLQYGGTQWLPRAKLHAFIDLWMREKDEDAEALLVDLQQ
jgi:hypothetical protein